MEQILSTLGLALRAGSVAVGEEPVGSVILEILSAEVHT